MKHRRLVLSFAIGSIGFVASAQQPPPLVQPPANIPPVGVSEEVQLGGSYESLSAGIAFRPPADCKRSGALSGAYLAEWSDERRDWTLKLGRMTLDHPAPLVNGTDNFGNPVEGILNRTVKNLQIKIPGSIVLRQDVTNTRDSVPFDKKHPEAQNNVGMIMIRYSDRGRRRLSQQAIIQTGDGVYYLLTLTTPGSAALAAGGPDDPVEVVAADTFGRMLDTVRLLDRKSIKIDQDLRLYQSRTAIVNWTANRVHRALLGEQWVRIIKNGKDIGYSYITEETSGGIPKPLTAEQMRANQENPGAGLKKPQDFKPQGDGVLVGVRIRTITDGVRSDRTKGPIQTDAADWFYTTLDRKHEDFSRVVVTDDFKAPKKGYLQEFGVSDKRVKQFLFHPGEDPNNPNAKPDGIVVVPDKNPIIGSRDDWQLDVNETSNFGAADPVMRKLPSFYIPQAMSHLLPRLLPLDKPQGYLFATYVSDAREILLRYIDVLPEQMITFNGSRERAVPIRDRLGLEGSPTFHYMTMDGRYIGSENPEQKLLMVPTDAQMLAGIWKDANLTRPGGVERGGPANADAGPGPAH